MAGGWVRGGAESSPVLVIGNGSVTSATGTRAKVTPCQSATATGAVPHSAKSQWLLPAECWATTCDVPCVIIACESVISGPKTVHRAGAAYGKPADPTSTRTVSKRDIVMAIRMLPTQGEGRKFQRRVDDGRCTGTVLFGQTRGGTT